MTAATFPHQDWLRPTVYFYGGALAVVGLATLGLGGFGHWTALIPLGLGVAAALAGFGARAGLYRDAVAAWIAVAIGVVALMGTLTAVPQLPYALAGSAEFANPGAVISRAATALVSISALLALAAAAAARRRARR